MLQNSIEHDVFAMLALSASPLSWKSQNHLSCEISALVTKYGDEWTLQSSERAICDALAAWKHSVWRRVSKSALQRAPNSECNSPMTFLSEEVIPP